MRAWVWILAGCGRVAFDATADGGAGDTGDAAVDAPAPTVIVEVDFTYNPDDFLDSGMPLPNPPTQLASLYAPFADGFAIGVGREVYEIRLDGNVVPHSYRPASFDTTGPDAVNGLVFGLDVLWLAASSFNGGDGLYTIDPAWTLTNEATTNNTQGVGFDPSGAFDGIGTPTLYVNYGGQGSYRRTGPGARVLVMPSASDLATLAVRSDAMYVVDREGPSRLYRVDAGTHAATLIDEDPAYLAVSDGQDVPGVLALLGFDRLVHYAPDGTSSDVAVRTSGPGWEWRAVTVPRAPHSLAGRRIVLESNNALGKFRLLDLTP